MGTGTSKQKPKHKQDTTNTSQEEGYTKLFGMFKQNKQSIVTHCIQSHKFSKNLTKFFPQFHISQTHFLEMIMYLRKYQPKIVHNKQALLNVKNTTLLDRFFMICLGNISCQTYYSMELTLDQIQNLLIDYYSLFIKNPSKGTLQKIWKFLKLQEAQKINPRKFAESFRQYFPHVQKYIKDYYYKKFHDGVKQFRILQNFQSKILKQDAILLALKLPQITKSQISELYNSQKYGIGFHSIQKKLIGYTGPWLLLIQHSEKDQQCQIIFRNGNRVKYSFGTYQNGPVKDVSSPQSDLTAFMFSIQPTIKFMTTDKGQGGNSYFFINNVDQKITKKRKGFGFGGNDKKQDCKLWIDQDMDKSKVFNGNDHTYGYGYLASPGTNILSIRRMQIWGLGNAQNLKQQAQYWSQRYQQIMKRRKVNKKDFVDSNAGLFFQNTFAHRQQVVGEIQKKQDKGEEDN